MTEPTHSNRYPNRWKKGQSGNPGGRPKGSRNKFSETLLDELADHFQKHGREAIEKVFEESPRDYLRIAASLVPKQMEIESARIPDMEALSTEELMVIAATASGKNGKAKAAN